MVLWLHAGISTGNWKLDFIKTAAKFHDELDIRRRSGVFSGFLNTRMIEFTDPNKMVLFWIRESEQIYGDQLVSVIDVMKGCIIA